MSDKEKISEIYRTKVLNKTNQSILISKIAQSKQSDDLTVPPNCNGYGRIRHFKIHRKDYWSPDPLPNLPYATKMSVPIEEVLRTQVFQIGACDFRCWFCFVDTDRLSGNNKFGEFLNANQLIEMYLQENNRPKVIDLSGGQPNLVPEWILWTMQAIEKNNLADVYLWADDNLSNYFYWKYLSEQERKYISNFKNFGKVACFKGIDDKSFAYNTNTNSNKYEDQFEIFNKYFNEGIDLYAYAVFTSQPFENVKKTIKLFIDKLQRIHNNLPLRTVPLEIELYSPTISKTKPEDKKAIEFQYIVHTEWREELTKRFNSTELNTLISNVKMDKHGR